MTSKKEFLVLLQFNISFYLIVSVAIYFLAFAAGNEGVSIRLFGGGDDGYFYWEQSQKIAKGQTAVITSIYTIIIGYLMNFLNITDVIIIRFFNFLGYFLLLINSLFLLDFTIKKNKNLQIVINRDDFKSKKLLIVLFTFYLSLIMNTTLSIYRDIWIYLFCLLSVKELIYFMNKKTLKIIHFILFILYFLLLYGFRTYAALSIILSLIIYKVLISKRRKTNILLLILLGGIVYTFFKNITFPIVNMSIEDALSYRDYFISVAPGGSQMNIPLDQNNYLLFLIFYFYSFIGNLLGPLPWQINNMSHILAFLFETIPFILILRTIYKKRKLLNKIHSFLIANSFSWFMLISLSNDNIGASTRLRVIGWILLIIVFSDVYYKKLKKRDSTIGNRKSVSNNGIQQID